MEPTPPSEPPEPEDLQFDRADLGDAAPTSALGCTACDQTITGAYYEINGEVVCEACQAKTLARRTGGSRLGRFVRATAFGALAGAAGAGIYYGISALTGYEFGLIAILVGFMVGFAVSFGSQQRGGWFYQLLAVGITYCSIVATYVPQIAEELRQLPMEELPMEEMTEEAAPGAGEQVLPVDADGDSPEVELAGALGEPEGLFPEEPEPGEVPEAKFTEPESTEPESANIVEADPAEGDVAMGMSAEAGSGEQLLVLDSGVLFWIFVVMLAFVAPFLGGFANILGILIIGFGLWQAWQLNRKQPLEISGPFQVAAAEA